MDNTSQRYLKPCSFWHEMKYFRAVFRVEASRVLTWKMLAFFLIILLALIYLIDDGIDDWNAERKNIPLFQAFERMKIVNWQSYVQYGGYGFYIKYFPAYSSIFFNNTRVFENIEAHIDVSERHEGRVLNEHSSFFDFSGVLFYVISIFSLYYGYAGLKNRSFMVFNIIGSGSYRYLLALIISRMIIITMIAYFWIISGVIYAELHYIQMPIIIVFNFMIALLNAYFFFIFGAFVSLFNSKTLKMTVLIGFVAISFILLPFLLSKYVKVTGKGILEDYESKLAKLYLLQGFEQRYKSEIEQHKRDNNGVVPKKKVLGLMDSYEKREYSKIEEIENRREQELEDRINKYYFVASLYPVTHFHAIAKEMGSRGYGGYLAFYKYCRWIKKDFYRYYVWRRYYSPTKKIVPYVKNNENVFYASVILTKNFLTGGSIALAYIVLAMLLLIFKFRADFCKISYRSQNGDRLAVNLNKSEHHYFTIPGEIVFCFGVAFLRENNHYFNLKLDELQLNQTNLQKLWIPKPDLLPKEIQLRNLIDLLNNMYYSGLTVESRKRFGDLNEFEKITFFLDVALKLGCGLTVFDSFISLNENFRRNGSVFGRIITELKKIDVTVVEVCENPYPSTPPDYQASITKRNGNYQLLDTSPKR